MVGNQYLYYDAGVGWSDGYFQLDSTTAPTQITFANNDYNSNPVFPLSATYTGTVAPPNFTVGFYGGISGLFAVAARLNYTPASSTATTTTYNVVNYSMSRTASFNPEDDFTMIFRYPEPSPTGPTGSAGPAGATGSQGPVGPTGAAAPTGVASLRMTGGTQAVANNTDSAVILDTVDIASTNTSTLTTDTSTGLITCVATGVYLVTARVNWTSTLGSGTYHLQLLINGSVAQGVNLGVGAPGTSGTLPADSTQSLTAMVNVTSANTTLGLQVSQNSGTSQSLTGSGSTTSYLFVKLLE